MAGWIVAAVWFGPGFVLGYRAAQARLRWLDALAGQGEIPERGSTLAFSTSRAAELHELLDGLGLLRPTVGR